VVKGFVIIGDVVGEQKVRFLHLIHSPLAPGQNYTDKGVGFEYDPFSRLHKWVRATDLKDMTFRFEATEIVYQDGSMDNF
jgi:hypothetical protein